MTDFRIDYCRLYIALLYYISPYVMSTGQGVDAPLSEIGFKQAEAAGRFLSGVKFTHVFSSDLVRAKQVS